MKVLDLKAFKEILLYTITTLVVHYRHPFKFFRT